MKPFAISCRPSSYGRYHPAAFEHLASIGVQYVEIALPAEGRAALENALREHGLRPATVALPENLVHRPDAERILREHIDFAQGWGAKIFFASVNTGEAGRDATIEKLRKLGEIAAGSGMVIALETHPDLITNGDTAAATMRDVNHPGVKVNFDTANLYYYNRDIDAPTELKKIVDHVVSVHIKDTGGGYEAWDFPGIGEGIVDFPAVLRILRDHGFRGPLTLEIEGRRGEELTEDEMKARVARSVENLRGWLADLGLA